MRKTLIIFPFLIFLLMASTAIAVPTDEDFDQIYKNLDENLESLDVIEDNLDDINAHLKAIYASDWPDEYREKYEDRIKDVEDRYKVSKEEFKHIKWDLYPPLSSDASYWEKCRNCSGSDEAIKRIKEKITRLKEDTARLDEKVKILKRDAYAIPHPHPPTPTPMSTPDIPPPPPNGRSIWWKYITITMIAITAGFGGYSLIKKRKDREPPAGL